MESSALVVGGIAPHAVRVERSASVVDVGAVLHRHYGEAWRVYELLSQPRSIATLRDVPNSCVTLGSPDIESPLAHTPVALAAAASLNEVSHVYVAREYVGAVTWLVAHQVTDWEPIPLGEMYVTECRNSMPDVPGAEVLRACAEEAMGEQGLSPYGPVWQVAHGTFLTRAVIDAALEEVNTMTHSTTSSVTSPSVEKLRQCAMRVRGTVRDGDAGRGACMHT